MGELVEVGCIVPHLRLEAGEHVPHRRRLGIEVDEDEAEHGLQADLGQREIGLVETLHLFAVARGAQPAFQVVGPGVVGAGDDGLEVAPAGEQFVGAVLADVVEGAQFPVVAAHDKHVLAADVLGQVVARPGDLRGMADETPGAEEDRLLLALEDAGIGIIGRRHVERAVGIGIEPSQIDGGLGHGAPLSLSLRQGSRGTARGHAPCPS